MLHVVAYNAVLYFQLMCVSSLLPTTPIIFPRCGPQSGKIIRVFAYTAEKQAAQLATLQKNF
jgi:hypothetical protein